MSLRAAKDELEVLMDELGAQDFITQNEIDELLKGVTGETDEE